MSDTGDSADPSTELLPDEPHTPQWLTLVGLALGLFAVIYYVATRPAGKTADELRRSAAPAAAPSAAEAASAAVAPAPAAGRPE